MCLQSCPRNHSVKRWDFVAQWLQGLGQLEISFWFLLWLPLHWQVSENRFLQEFQFIGFSSNTRQNHPPLSVSLSLSVPGLIFLPSFIRNTAQKVRSSSYWDTSQALMWNLHSLLNPTKPRHFWACTEAELQEPEEFSDKNLHLL